MNAETAKGSVRPGDVVVLDDVGPFRVVDTRDSLLGYGPLHADDESFARLSWSDVDEYIPREYSESIDRFIDEWDPDEESAGPATTEAVGADQDDVEEAVDAVDGGDV